MTHKTKGIVLKNIQYGDSSLIVNVYTELLGLQKYIIKGIRKNTRTGSNKMAFFQPGSILEMEVYKNDLKQLQFIKEYDWSYRYNSLYFDVIKNAIATYIIELFQNTVSDTEENEELYSFLEHYLINIDKSDNKQLANLPLFFSIELCKLIGFQINEKYSSIKNKLDLQAGGFTADLPTHSYFLEGKPAEITSYINQNLSKSLSSDLQINREMRRNLLNSYQIYITLHVENFHKLKSLPILQTVI